GRRPAPQGCPGPASGARRGRGGSSGLLRAGTGFVDRVELLGVVGAAGAGLIVPRLARLIVLRPARPDLLGILRPGGLGLDPAATGAEGDDQTHQVAT